LEKVQLPEVLREALDYLEGKSLDEKLARLVASDLKRRLQICFQRIVDFEAKYGMEFDRFAQAWQAGEIPSPYSYEVEHDYMEWESVVDEFKQLLSYLRRLKRRPSPSQ